jgi:FkbM family methyltransferase
LWLLRSVERWRTRYHPLHQIRRVSAFRRIARAIDRQVWARLYGIPHPVRLYLLRNGSYLVNRRSPEPRLAALVLAILRTRRVASFWDVGAHIGYYSWLVASESPDTRIVAIEPDPTNQAVLHQSRLYAPAVNILDVAISRVDGSATFLTDAVSGATGTLESQQQTFNFRNYAEPSLSLSVKTRSLDSLEIELGVPDLVKIDVEGHEHSVIEGASQLLTRHPLIIIEAFDGSSAALSRLRVAGYRLFGADALTDAPPDDGNYLAIPEAEADLMSPLRDAYHRALADAGLTAAA